MTFNSEIKRLLCETRGFIGRKGLSRSLLPSYPGWYSNGWNTSKNTGIESLDSRLDFN